MKILPVLFTILVLGAIGYGVYALVANTQDIPEENGDNGDVADPTDTDGDDTEDEPALADTVNVYVVDLEAGNIGCGDAVEAIERDIEPTAGVLVAALNELFTLPADEFGTEEEFYNALEGSDLAVESATVENGVATVDITGEVSVGGVCDNPRFEEQILQTVLQFETVDSAEITVNGTPLGDLFSAQGA